MLLKIVSALVENLVELVLLLTLALASCGIEDKDVLPTNSSLSVVRVKRQAPRPQNGFFFPIAMYTVRHNRPGGSRRPETWEYRGQYFYGYRPRPNSGRRRATRLLAAGLPLLLAPLLSIIFSFPVVVPVATAVTGASIPGQFVAPSYGKKRRKKRNTKPANDKDIKLKELEVVSSYLRQVDYDEKQQSRVMVNYLQCNGLLGPEDHCLERLACEFGDPTNQDAPELEKMVTSILLGHILNNEFVPRPFQKRLKNAAVHGRNNSGQCGKKFFCNYVDNNWDYVSVNPHHHHSTQPLS